MFVSTSVGGVLRFLQLVLIAGLGLFIATGPSLGAEDQARPTPGFARPTFHEPPKVERSSWVRNPIDQFVLAKLEAAGLSPAPEAPREALIRRAYLDLIGLPPTPQQVQEFVSDPDPQAYEKLVDRLLASPQYGERWARHWLDLARYAESEGFKADETRPYAWRYRDWVIDSLNQDMPYDRFIREQIAGDEIWPENPQAHIATYFLRSYPDESNARELFQRRQEILNDDTDVIGAVFLGMTMGCARCHDHKYDPITQADYYRLQAFLADMRADDNIPVASAEKIREHNEKLAAWEEKTKSIRQEMGKLEEPKRKAIIKDYFKKYPSEIQTALNKPEDQRTSMDWLLYYKAQQYLGPNSYQYIAPPSACLAGMSSANKKRWQELNDELGEFADQKPKDLPLGTGVCDAGPEAPKTFLLKRGVFNAPKDEVEPGYPMCLDSREPKITPGVQGKSTGRRTALANWLSSPDNPMTAKVMVNRVWYHHFGQGIVRTPSDFGVQGEPATHPELLDWLAIRFVQDGWSLKKLHRLIMTSATYRQSGLPGEKAAKADADDKLLSRFPLKRLEAETIRDSALAIAGLLNPKMGGPSIFPEIPKGMTVRGGWAVTKDEAERNRRSIYVFVRRNTRYPMFEAFDMPDPYATCPRRYVSTTSLQALMLLNSELAVKWAQHFAGRVLSEAGSDPGSIVDVAYRFAYCRHANADEIATGSRFLDEQESRIGQREDAAMPVYPEGKTQAESISPARAAAVVDLCHVLINSNEFVYSD